MYAPTTCSTAAVLRPLRACLPAYVLILLVSAQPATAQEGATLPTIAEKTAGTLAMPGLFTLYWNDAAGLLLWEIDELDGEFLYQISMGSGLGSNPIGIDRGQLRGTHVLRPMRVGPRLLLVEPNYRFVASSENPAEAAAVRDAFAPSVHWGFDIVAETGERVLVDATPFFLRDARGVVEQIARSGQGRFQLELSRSAIWLPNTKSFPENTEVEALLTFTSAEPGGLVEGVAADGGAVTLRQHHSFRKLPGPGYRTRLADPRIGVNGPDIFDYATPDRRGREDPPRGPSPAPETEPGSDAVRADRADRLLCRPRYAGADPERADRRRGMVEPGLRGCGIHRCVPGKRVAGHRRPTGHPLQRDPLDTPADTRILVRELGGRPQDR